ncbi:MAG: TIGR01777 family oxidoreductase [Spirochaetota bacterium]
MKIAVTGGLGFAGTYIVPRLIKAGHDVTVFDSKNESEFPFEGACYVRADLMKEGSWQKFIADNEVIINLAGANIFQRWSDKKKQLIYNSRIQTTKNIVNTLPQEGGEVKVLINASAAGFYGFHKDEIIDETVPGGKDFLAEICKDWEKEALKAADKGVRVVICRFGTIFGKEGGAFPKLKKIFRLFMGARLGSGKQWFPWVHIEDVAQVLTRAFEDESMEGPYNCVAPGGITNKELTSIMGSAVERPVVIPFVPGMVLRVIFGEFGLSIVKGQRVVPAKLIKEGYNFRFPELKAALEDLIK